MEKSLIFRQEVMRSITRSCRNCERTAVYNNFCKYCWSAYTKKYRIRGKYVKQPPKLLKLIGPQELITTYDNAANIVGITKNYLYVAISKGLIIKGYKFEKC